MIDWTRVRELRDEVGAEDFDEVVELFIEEVDEVTARLRFTPEPTALEADFHFLKGSALSLGFEDFAALCQKGETASAQGRSGDVDLALIISSYEVSKSTFLSSIQSKLAD